MRPPCRIDGKIVEGRDRDLDPGMLGDRLRYLGKQLHPRLDIDQRLLAVMSTDTEDELVDDPSRPGNDVEMPIGHGVEAARIETRSRHGPGIDGSPCRRNSVSLPPPERQPHAAADEAQSASDLDE